MMAQLLEVVHAKESVQLGGGKRLLAQYPHVGALTPDEPAVVATEHAAAEVSQQRVVASQPAEPPALVNLHQMLAHGPAHHVHLHPAAQLEWQLINEGCQRLVGYARLVVGQRPLFHFLIHSLYALNGEQEASGCFVLSTSTARPDLISSLVPSRTCIKKNTRNQPKFRSADSGCEVRCSRRYFCFTQTWGGCFTKTRFTFNVIYHQTANANGVATYSVDTDGTTLDVCAKGNSVVLTYNTPSYKPKK